MVRMVCKRLPASEATLSFLSTFIAQEHIQAGLDDRLRDAYGVWRFFTWIRFGKNRAYGVFELNDAGEAERFCGFQLGNLDADGFFENHAFWGRKIPTLQCVTLCCQEMRREYDEEGIDVRGVVSYIPDCNRAAKLLARRFGCKDGGLRADRIWMKRGKSYPCREFRMAW